jgi:hypothetical protein
LVELHRITLASADSFHAIDTTPTTTGDNEAAASRNSKHSPLRIR